MIEDDTWNELDFSVGHIPHNVNDCQLSASYSRLKLWIEFMQVLVSALRSDVVTDIHGLKPIKPAFPLTCLSPLQMPH